MVNIKTLKEMAFVSFTQPHQLVQNIGMAETNIFNKAEAFKKLVETKEFKLWHKAEVARRLGHASNIDRIVDEQMKLHNLKIEET